MIRWLQRQWRQKAWRSLSVQMLTFVIIPLVLVLIFITLRSVALHETAMRDLVAERDERAARMAAAVLDDQLNGRVDLTRALAALPASESGEMTALQAASLLERSADLLAEFDGQAAYLDDSGQVLASTSGLASPLPMAIQQGWHALQADPGLEYTITGNFNMPPAPGLMTAVLVPGSYNRVTALVVFSVTTLAGDSLSSLILPENAVGVWVIDRGGQELYHAGSVLHDSTVSHEPDFDLSYFEQPGSRLTTVDGHERIIAYSPLSQVEWVLLIEEPWEHVSSPQLQLTQLAPLVMIPVALLALIGLLFGARQVVQPLQNLAKQSEQLGWGDYMSIRKPVGGIEEIRQLQMELMHMAHKVQSAQNSLHSYIGAITAGQEDERQRLARELHDETIQAIIVLKQRIQLAQMDWADHPVAETLRELESSAEQTIGEVRRMVRALRPIYLEDLGLSASLSMLAKEAENQLGIPVLFERSGDERRLDGPVELSLYRIVQEALNNIAHHARATRAAVRVRFTPQDTILTIEDNGRGFGVPKSPSAFAASGHFGLLGMQERAELLNARFEILSEPGQGTTVTVQMPG